MLDNRKEQTGNDHDTDSLRAASLSKCYQCMRMFLPICLMSVCFGAVVLVAGIISLIVFGAGGSRAIMSYAGGFVVALSLIFYVVFKGKVAEVDHKAKCSKTRGLDLSVEVASQVVPPCHDEPQQIPERLRPSRCEEVVSAVSRAPTLSPLEERTSVFEDKELPELEIVNHFDIPPSYEEATAGKSEYYIHGKD